MCRYIFLNDHDFTSGSRASVSLKWIGLASVVAVLASGIGCTQAKSEPTKTQIVIADPNVIQIAAPERFGIHDVSTESVFDELHMNGVVAPDVSRTVPVLSLSGAELFLALLRVRIGFEPATKNPNGSGRFNCST